MIRLLVVLCTCLCSVAVNAQLLRWSPPFPVENNPAQTLAITMDATKGNQGLLNHTPTSDVYVHIGVITSLSSGATDWKYVKFAWGATDPAAQAAYTGSNTWTYTINGSLRSFFNITNPSETIRKIAILFRSGNGSKKQANTDGSDMYLPVYSNSLAVRIVAPATQPAFTPITESTSFATGSHNFRAVVNAGSTVTFFLNGQSIGSAQALQANDTVGVNHTIGSDGFYQLVAQASDGTATVNDTLNLTVGNMASPVVALPAGLRDGINYESNGTAATLVLRAPGKNLVTVIGEFNNWTQSSTAIMNKTPDGNFFWLRLTNLQPGVEYAFQYKVDNNLTIADPYAEKILDPYNNNDENIPAATYPILKPYPTGKTTGIVSILQTQAPAYTWTNNSFVRPDARGLVVYELLLRDFIAAHDWKTLKDTLSYLKTLGINAIEIMPFNEFEGNNSWGYNPDFYFAPDKYYGDKNSLKAFVDAAHNMGIAVIMDIALNHSFGLSPMVQLYFDAANNRPAANSPWFNPEPKHPFNVGYDMNHESAHTKYFVGRVVEHWIREYRIDGFRFDLSKGFTQQASGNDVNLWSRYDASRIAIWKGYYDTVRRHAPDAYVILEHFADNSEEKELSDYGMLFWGNLNYNYSEAAMGWIPNSNFQGALHTVRGWTKPYLVSYMESHDEERLMYRNLNFGNAAGPYNTRDTATALKRMALDAAFFFTLPGPKMIWQFGELGYPYSINHCTNGTVNNNCRLDPKPIRWDYLNDPRRKELYEVYRNLIRLRFHPQYRDAFMSNRVEHSLSGAFKWIRVTTDTSNLMVVGNFDVAPATGTVTFQNAGGWYDYLNNTTFSATGSSQTMTLQAGEFHIYVNRNVNNLAITPVRDIRDDVFSARLFPNPIATENTLQLTMPQSGRVQLSIWNIHGQKIKDWKETFLAAGSHQIRLDKKDMNISTGLYFIRIASKEATQTVSFLIQ